MVQQILESNAESLGLAAQRDRPAIHAFAQDRLAAQAVSSTAREFVKNQHVRQQNHARNQDIHAKIQEPAMRNVSRQTHAAQADVILQAARIAIHVRRIAVYALVIQHHQNHQSLQ